MSIVLCAGSLVGCATGAAPVRVIVRDAATQAPIDGAVVSVRPLHLFGGPPEYLIIDPSPPRGETGVTDARGEAQLITTPLHPFELAVLAEGYLSLEHTIENVHRFPDAGWLRSASLDAIDRESLRELEVRIDRAD